MQSINKMKKDREFSNDLLKEIAAEFHKAQTTGIHHSPTKYIRDKFNLDWIDTEMVFNNVTFDVELNRLQAMSRAKYTVEKWMQTIDFSYAKSQGYNMAQLKKNYLQECLVPVSDEYFAELLNNNPQIKELNF